MQVDVGAESKRAADEPSEQDTENAAKKPHDSSFDKEKLLDVAVGGAERFEDADFAAALENRHHERVDDSESGHSERQAAENAEKKIKHGKENAQAFGGVEKREGAEAKIFEFGFGGFHERRAFHANGEA